MSLQHKQDPFSSACLCFTRNLYWEKLGRITEMEYIHLHDGTTIETIVSNITPDGSRGSALLLAPGYMNLFERLAQSTEIPVERDDQGNWKEVKHA